MAKLFEYLRKEPKMTSPLITSLTLLLALTACATSETKTYDWVQVPGIHSPKKPMATDCCCCNAAQPAQPGNLREFADLGIDRVYFDTDKSFLRPDAIATLDRQVEWLNRNPGIVARIEGNTDERASGEYNFGLGYRRAEAVRGYLASRGIAASRLYIVSHGKTQPIAYGSTADALARNRNALTTVAER
jgi:peptidoglycan-associated lipoprotein